jgi:serine/threonine-protein kinase PknK
MCSTALIIAPGGFGKSVALEHFLETSSVDHVRCVLTSADRTHYSFARRLLELLPVSPAARETIEEALRAPERPPVELAQLYARYLTHYTGLIAIDDLHYADGASTSAFLAALVDATVPRIRWVIATRSHKELPVAEWITRGTCAAPLLSDELAFTHDEATAVASVLSGVSSEDDIQKILALRGFPLAFILAVRFARTGSGASNVIAQVRELTYDYLARHVYDVLTADEQRHLQFGALMRTFDCEMFEQAGFSSARPVLQRLYRHGSFLMASDNPNFYDCNDVFFDFLEEQLRQGTLEEQRTLRKMAADVLSARNRFAEAMTLYAQAQEYESLLSHLQRHGLELIDAGQSDLIRDLLERIPREIRDKCAIAIALEALLIGDEERFAQAEALFCRALALSVDEQEHLAISFRFALYQMLTKVDDAAQRFAEVARAPGVSSALRVAALSQRLLALSWLDPFHDASTGIQEIELILGTCERDVDRLKIVQNVGIAAMYAGDDRALDLLDRVHEASERKGFLSELCSVYQCRALFALYCDNDFAAARGFAECRHYVGQRLTGGRARRGGLLLDMLIAVRAGDASRARELLAEHANQPLTEDASFSATISRVQAMLAAWSGDYARAYKLLQPVLPFVFPFYRPIAQALCTLAGAAAGLAVDDLINEQIRLLRESKPRSARAVEREHTARALLAIAATVSGKNTAANRLLAGSKGELSRLPLLLREVVVLMGDRRDDRPPAAASALEELSRIGFNDLRAFLVPLLQKHHAELRQKALTEAEVAVLRLMDQGLSPKEIAELRNASVHTIRKQLQNVRVKLNSHSIDQIVARAHALGLL